MCHNPFLSLPLTFTLFPRNLSYMKTIAVVLLLALTARAVDSVRLPFESQRSLLLVSVTVNGQPKTLIFDTGAERTMIHERNASVERQRTSVTLDGKTFIVPVIFADLADMQIAKAKADGVLGQDIIRRFTVITIDYTAKTVTLQ
jgi:hypothetical protein